MRLLPSALVASALLIAGAASAQNLTDDANHAGHRVAQTGRATGHAVANAGREVGHATAVTARKSGHAVAKAGRKTGHAVAQTGRDLKTKGDGSSGVSTENSH